MCDVCARVCEREGGRGGVRGGGRECYAVPVKCRREECICISLLLRPIRGFYSSPAMPPAPVRSLSAARIDSSSLSLGTAATPAGPSDRRIVIPIEKTGDAARLVQWALDHVYKG